ncbi:MFS transporter [Mesorhizobium waimense]|uniref:MFS transporter n=1 Tax=Mesorhizobium waimense TaxID=1300307 RepID=A0A3A5KXC9_9HYPH|nr:MFS transporter [Mesorhizobium waimense]RJT41415.1 MFS transporter [Mesorhizobium waimense]
MTHQPHTRLQTLAAESAMILGAFLLGTSEFAAMGLLPEMARDSHVTIDVAGTSVTAYALGVVIGAPLIATMAAKTSRHMLLVFLLLFCAAGNALSALSGSFSTLIAARFMSGLPHGAYFGIASLIAATLAHPGRRAQAVARVMMGLGLANLIGAPLGTFIGEHTTWRLTYFLLAVLAALAAIICRASVPAMQAAHGSGPLKELSALAKPQVWLAFGIGSVGLGGLFAVYTYLVPTLISVTGISESDAPLVLVVIGLGMFVGNFLGGWLADRGIMRATGILLVLNLVAFAIFFFSVHNTIAISVSVFLAGLAALALVPPLQARLMDVAGHAQALGAMLNGCAINVANALGAALGGAVIAAHLSPASTGLVGVVMAALALVIFFVALSMEKHLALNPSQGR